MARETTAAQKDNDLQMIYDAAEQQWASRVINTLLAEAENGELATPERFKLNGISITRNRTDDGWTIRFHILEKK